MCPIKRRKLKFSFARTLLILFCLGITSCYSSNPRCSYFWLGPNSFAYPDSFSQYKTHLEKSNSNTIVSQLWFYDTDSTFITDNHYADGYLWNVKSGVIYHFNRWEWSNPIKYPFYGLYICGDPGHFTSATTTVFSTPQSVFIAEEDSYFEYNGDYSFVSSTPLAIVIAGESESKIVWHSTSAIEPLPEFNVSSAFDVPPSRYLSNQKFSQLLLKTCRERYCDGRSSDCPREKTTFSFALCGGAYDEMIIENPGKASIYAWDVETGETLSLGNYSWSGSVDYPFYDFSVIDGKRTDYPLCEFPWEPFHLSEEKQTRTFGITVRFDDDYGCFDADSQTRFYSIRHVEDKDGFSERISPADFDSAWVYPAPTIE